jgi:hypothetical protein
VYLDPAKGVRSRSTRHQRTRPQPTCTHAISIYATDRELGRTTTSDSFDSYRGRQGGRCTSILPERSDRPISHQRTMDLRTHTSVSFKGATLTINLVPQTMTAIDAPTGVSSLPKKAHKSRCQRVSCYTWLESRAQGGWEKTVPDRRRPLHQEMRIQCRLFQYPPAMKIGFSQRGESCGPDAIGSSTTNESSQSCLGEKIDYCGLQIQARLDLL